jgi:hypothetical protein
MAAEALSSLGYDQQVSAWVETYKAAHPPIDPPPAGQHLDLDDQSSWAPALGDGSRISDWAAAFAEELNNRPWEAVVGRWAAVLLPGYGGGLTHGLLRTAHAVRAMPPDTAPSPLMLQELSRGLAMWAAVYTALPNRPHPGGPRRLAAAVLALPRPTDPWTMIEAGTFSRMSELAGFGDAVDALARPNSIEAALSDLSETFCRVLLASSEVFPVPLVHTVTPIAAIRSVLPYLPAGSAEAVFAQLWQVNAAIIAGFTRGPVSLDETAVLDAETPTSAELAARAAEHGDPHAIKFTEAALREDAIRPSGVYLHAAHALLDRLPSA